MLSTLEEVALHQQNIERIELLGHLCPKLKILYLQNNLIGKIQHLHRLKDLQYLNLAVNNITKVQNLQRCESLQKLDLTLNFVPKAGLLSIPSLAGNYNLRELFLIGNPCTDWHGYRQYIVGKLPQLAKLDGQAIKVSERIAAAQVLASLEQQLLQELQAEGVDVAAAAGVEDDSSIPDGEVAETGFVDEAGELRRPWCPATRILEHREMEKANREAETARSAAQKDPLAQPAPPPKLEDFPPLPEDGRVLQRNEGKWHFTLEESEDGASLVLDVAVGKYLDTSLIKADVQPRLARLIIKGRLLQLVLPVEVKPDSSVAQRSAASGHLVLTMPKEEPGQAAVDVAYLRPGDKPAKAAAVQPAAKAAPKQPHKQQAGSSIQHIVKRPGAAAGAEFLMREVRKAAVVVAADGDDDQLPDL
uniref:Dynein axonemal assembly factor 11-like CS domain-containing protein n=1 Tax=Tetradesmus obliquus TaxID=3088 RepID=A0A383WCJ9_TETOB|eukprot:jgi/Sobl393_1/173/SZX74912.1